MLGISDLFTDDAQFMPKLSVFERNLFLDYVNRPYVRWLFAEWFDVDENSEVIKPEHIANTGPDHAYHWSLWRGGIRRRFSQTAKTPYSAYEFRFFDMPPTVKQLSLQVRFLIAWVSHHQAKVFAGQAVEVTITQESFDKLRNLRHAWSTISAFLTELKLNPRDYRPFFEDQYINRMRHGKMT